MRWPWQSGEVEKKAESELCVDVGTDEVLRRLEAVTDRLEIVGNQIEEKIRNGHGKKKENGYG